MPFAASPTFGFLYRSTVATYPQAYLFLVIAIYFLLMILIYAIHSLGLKSAKSAKAEKGQQ